MATFSLLGSVTNPSLPSLLHLTVDITMTSASLPYNTWGTRRSAPGTTVHCIAVQSSGCSRSCLFAALPSLFLVLPVHFALYTQL